MGGLKPNSIPLELRNGETVQLTINFPALYRLRSTNKGFYARFNKIITSGVTDLLDNATVIYGAYLCGNSDDGNKMTETEFMELLPADMGECGELAGLLIAPKKMMASADRSKSGRSENAAE